MRAFWAFIKTYLEFSTSGTPSASNAIWFDGTIFKKKQGGVVTDLDTGGGGGGGITKAEARRIAIIYG